MTDTEIVEKLRKDQLKDCDVAFRYLYTHHFESVQSMILKNKGSRVDAKDVFQDAMVILYNKIRSPQFTLSSKFSTYLYAISRNLWLKRLKKAKREVNIEDVHMSNIPMDVVADLNDKVHKSNAVSTLLEKSGEKCLKLLKMFYYERRTMNEIAEIFGLSSEQVAKNKKVRCLKKIRLVLNNSEAIKEALDY